MPCRALPSFLAALLATIAPPWRAAARMPPITGADGRRIPLSGRSKEAPWNAGLFLSRLRACFASFAASRETGAKQSGKQGVEPREVAQAPGCPAPMAFPMAPRFPARVFPTMFRTKPALLVGLAALGLALVAAVPSASATSAIPASCGADVNFWDASYSCKVSYVGPAGSVTWCPDPYMCANGDIVSCYVDLTPPWYCQLL